MPKAGSVVMFIECSDIQDPYKGWVRVLHEEKLVEVPIHPMRWMDYFIPWPHGAFIG